jgi:hypothetical protein
MISASGRAETAAVNSMKLVLVEEGRFGAGEAAVDRRSS